MRRHELSNFEWSVIRPLHPNKPRGVPRLDDRRVLSGICGGSKPAYCGRVLPSVMGHIPPVTTALSGGVRRGCGTILWGAGHISIRLNSACITLNVSGIIFYTCLIQSAP